MESDERLIYYLPSPNDYLLRNDKVQSFYKTVNQGTTDNYFNRAIQGEINETEYILRCDAYYCEFTDYFNNIVTYKAINDILGAKLKSDIFEFLSLKERNTFFIAINTGITTSNFGMLLEKFTLISNDISGISLTSKNYDIKGQNKILSCFETEKSLIECLYINKTNYKYHIEVFDTDLYLKEQIILDDTIVACRSLSSIISFSFYAKIIHLQKEIGIFILFQKMKVQN